VQCFLLPFVLSASKIGKWQTALHIHFVVFHLLPYLYSDADATFCLCLSFLIEIFIMDIF